MCSGNDQPLRAGMTARRSQGGFTLVEIMVALLVFMLGALGIALYTAASLKTTATNQVRSTALKAASLAVEPVLYHTRPDCLQTVLGTFPKSVLADNGKDSYTVSLVTAQDGTSTTIASGTTPTASSPSVTSFANASSTWVSPVTVTLGTPYVGLNGSTVTVYTSHTIILQDYTLACNG